MILYSIADADRVWPAARSMATMLGETCAATWRVPIPGSHARKAGWQAGPHTDHSTSRLS